MDDTAKQHNSKIRQAAQLLKDFLNVEPNGRPSKECKTYLLNCGFNIFDDEPTFEVDNNLDPIPKVNPSLVKLHVGFESFIVNLHYKRHETWWKLKEGI